MKWKIQENETGEKNLILIKNGKCHYIYSKTNPEGDGLKFFQSVFNGSGLYIIIGIGYFYHLLPFLESKDVEHLIVVEPDEVLLKLIKDSKYFIQMMAYEKVSVIKGNEEVKRFIQDIRGNYNLLFYDRLNILSYPYLERLLPEQYKNLKKKIKLALDSLFRDALTIATFSKRWLLNFKENLKGIIKSNELISLREVYDGECIVAAAGPSLDKAIKYLENTDSRKYFIIAVDAAVRPLILSDIIPDIIISIDPQPYIRLHFLGIEEKLRDIPAILNPMSHSDVFKLFVEMYLYPTKHPLLKIIDSSNYLSKEGFNFGSVSSLAVKIACFLGFKKLHLIGFDYAYSNYRSYAKESFFYKYIIVNSHRFKPFFTREIGYISGKLKGNSDKSKMASEDLNNYKKEMESLIKSLKKQKSDFKLLRLFPSKIAIKGTEVAERIPTILNYSQVKEIKNVRIQLKLDIFDNVKENIITSLTLYYRLIKGYGSEKASKNAKNYCELMFSLFNNKIKSLT